MSQERNVLHLEYWYSMVFSTLALANKASTIFGYLPHNFAKQQIPRVTPIREDFTLSDHCLSMLSTLFSLENANIYLK